VLPTLRI